MRFMRKGKWKQGEITVEAETIDELNKSLNTLLSLGKVEKATEESIRKEGTREEFPPLPAGSGCSDAIRALLQTDWGRQQPRSMKDIENALQANALYFSSGTLSGTLNLLTKSGTLRRFKRDGRWAYVLR